MTRRERLEAVIAENITAELIEDCKAELKKLDERNAARAEKETPRQKENAIVEARIIEVLSGATEPMLSDDLLEAVKAFEDVAELGDEMTRNRLTGICNELKKKDVIKNEDVKVPKKGKRKAYSLV